MADFIEILRQRRSIREYENRSLTTEQTELLKEALLRAPSSRGSNPWQFIVVSDNKLLENLSKAKAHGSNFLANASLAFVICADESISDVWIEDCSIAAITLQYAATSIGLGSCWAQIRLREHNDESSAENYTQKLLGIPSHIRVASIIGIGHPAEKKEGHAANLLPKKRFHDNKFQGPK